MIRQRSFSKPLTGCMATLIGCAAFVVASGPVLSTASGASTLPGDAQVLPASQVVELASPGGPLTAPVDGRLRGPDFNAQVNGVAWPTAAGVAPSRYVAGSGHRLVVFALTLTQPSAAVGVLGNGTATVSASLGTDPTG